MRLVSYLVLLLCVGPPLFLLWCLLSPPLWSYHPFHPNHSHLPSSYVGPDSALSAAQLPAAVLSSSIVPSSFIEGWYLKLRTAGGRHFALIYLYFVSSDPDDSTAAITLLDAQNERSHIFKFPIEQFHSSPLPTARQSLHFLLHSATASTPSTTIPTPPPTSSPYHDFELHVANNTMSPYAVTATLNAAGQSEAWVSANVSLTLHRPLTASSKSHSMSARYSHYPWSTVFSPASHTVGLFAFLPLACYQQVIELQLAVSGHMLLDGEHIDFDDATAYFEKTRGSTFPDNYLWIHASHFTDSHDREGGTVGADGDTAVSDSESALSSFFFSLASVPILPTSLRLPGFVCSFVLDGVVSHFATQLGSVLTSLSIDERAVQFVLYDQYFTTRVAVIVTRHTSPVHQDSWLWAARNGRLRRVIPQQIGRDTVHVTIQHVTAPIERQSSFDSRNHTASGDTETARTEVARDAQSFVLRGYSFALVSSSSSASVGLEVYVHESDLQQQVGVMYEEVRPWLTHRYLPIDTPLVSFSLSIAFLRSLLPEVITRIIDRVGVKHTPRTGIVLIVASVAIAIFSLLMTARRRSPKVKAE